MTPRANIAAGKAPAQIAADLVRRILPATDVLIARAIASDADTTLREAWVDRTRQMLLRACPLPLEASRHERRERGASLELCHWGEPHVTAKMEAYSQTVTLTLDDLSSALAASMLALLPPAKEVAD